MIKPEIYDEYGNIIPKTRDVSYRRTMSAYDTHRIHDTKDLFDSDCSYCRDKASKKSFFTCSECKTDCYTRQGLKDHWLLEH